MARGPFVGRQPEIAALVEAADDARGGSGGCVLLVGEPGIGKSRLVEELARLAASDMDVVWGRAWEAGGAPPYWPWTQVLRGVSAPVASAYVARLRGDTTDASTSAPNDRFLIFDAVTRHLTSAVPRPTMIVLEDLHAADEPSLHLLEFFVGQLRSAPLLVVGTYRDVEARLTPAAGAVLDRIARSARVIHPRRLGREEVLELAQIGGQSLSRDALAAVYERSEGNPLFVVELVRVIARLGGQGAIPASVRTAIREHLRGLPAEIVPVLEAAAVIGRELAASVVAEITKRPLPDVLQALSTAVELGVLVERGPARFAFSHGLIAETLHADIPSVRRAPLHLAVADALEREAVRPLTEIAHHLLDAGEEQAERAAEAAKQAAEGARRQLAFEPAVALIERVLATAPPKNQLMRYELQRLLAEVRLLGGDDEAGKAAAREAAALGRALQSPELLARAALTYGLSYSYGFTDQVMVQLIEEALAALPDGDSSLRARLLARLAGALTPAADARVPMQIGRDAIAMARRLGGDDRTRLDVIHAALSALIPFAVPSERRALSLEVLELAERFEEPLLVLRSLHRLVFDYSELGDLLGADQRHRLYDELVERLRLSKARWQSAMFRAMRALFVGDLAANEAAVAEALELARAAGDTFLERTGLQGHRYIRARILGDDETIDRERDAFTTFAGPGPMSAIPEIMANIHCRAGRFEAARALAKQTSMYEKSAGVKLAQIGSVGAEVAWQLGDLEGASVLYAWLRAEDPPFGALHSHGYGLDRPTAHGAMLLAATLGDLSAAREHYEHALALVTATGARPHEAWLRLDFARVLIASGERGEEPRALLVEARAINDHVGMLLAPRIAAAEASLASPAPPVVPAIATTMLVRLRCEGDVWVVEGLGASCRIKASRGIEMLAKLVAEPNRELHVLDLEGAEVVDAGDAGEVLDAEAKRAYKARILALRETLEEATSWNNSARAEKARDELEALETELARAAGLGGRDRRVGKAAERARINVQRRITDSIKRIGELDAEIGKHLTAAIRTGTYCSYAPERVSRPTR